MANATRPSGHMSVAPPAGPGAPAAHGTPPPMAHPARISGAPPGAPLGPAASPRTIIVVVACASLFLVLVAVLLYKLVVRA